MIFIFCSCPFTILFVSSKFSHRWIHSMKLILNDYLTHENSSALRSLLGIPGILALKSPLEVSIMAECFQVDLATLVNLMKQCLPFLTFSRHKFAVMVAPTLVEFSRHPGVPYYQDYQKHETMLLCQYLQCTSNECGSFVGSDWGFQIDDISTTSLENNIDTFILFLRKFIRNIPVKIYPRYLKH